MMLWFKTVEEIKYDDILEDSDGDMWYNKDGDQIVRFDESNTDQNIPQKEILKYGVIFLDNLNCTYKWVVKVSKLDEVIFDLVWNRIKSAELPYLTTAISNTLNSYNLNVLIKTLKLLSLLILKFKEEYSPFTQQLKSSLVKSMSTQKAAFMIEISKVFYYLSKYWMTPGEYIQFIWECIDVAKGVTAWKVLVEILITYIHTSKPSFEAFKTAKSFIPWVESIWSKTPICINHFSGIILLEIKEVYPDDFDKILSPFLENYIKDMNEGKIKRLTLAKTSMITKYTIGLESVESDYMSKDLELLDEGYESFEQLSEETSSQCSSDFDFIENEEIPEDIFLDLGSEEVPQPQKDDKNWVIF